MKKSTLITLAAALLLTAVLCTAGCVEAPSDPIVGTYITETDSAVSWAVFENEGTGCFAGDAGDAVFTWAAADSKNTYTLLFADGRAVTAVLNAEHGVLNVNGVLYQKTVSPLSGAVRGAEHLDYPFGIDYGEIEYDAAFSTFNNTSVSQFSP